MTWKSVDSDADLEAFADSVCWSDSRTIEFHGNYYNEPYFPPDISRSGRQYMNLRVLLDPCGQPDLILEIVFVECEQTTIHFLTHLFVRGRVDTLKRVTLEDAKGQMQLRCSRLIYRFLAKEKA